MEPRSSRFAPSEGWLVLVLLAGAMYAVVESIIGAQWVNHSNWLLLSALIGLFIGLIIAKVPRCPQILLHLGACTAGYGFSVWLASAVAFHLPWRFVVGNIWVALTGRFATLGVPAGEVVFFFYLSFLCFFLGYFGSWLIYRACLPWLVALVYASIMLVNLNNAKQDMTYLTIILSGALLLLVARMQLVIQMSQWIREGLHTSRQGVDVMKRRSMQVATLIVIATLVFGWVLPIRSQDVEGKTWWDRLNNVWVDAVNGHLTWDTFQDRLSPTHQANFFDDQLTVINTVYPPIGEVLRYQSTDGPNDPHYLEGFTFNLFDGRTWRTSLDESKIRFYQANDLLPEDVPQQNLPQSHVRIVVTRPPEGAKHYIFAPATPRYFSVPTFIYNDGTTSAWIQQKTLGAHEVYDVAFVPPSVDDKTLVLNSPALGDAFAWESVGISAQYFQVPATISSDVKKKALEWTDGDTDIYTALKSLERHLNDKTVFTYSLDNPPVPANTDIISWLLQTKRGYCTYYATAMTVMGRMLGIPTRIVNGFSQGGFDANTRQWVVNGGDAHSWVQAFIPNQGWVNFDPTPGFAPNAFPTAQQSLVTPTVALPPSPTKQVTATPSPTAVQPTSTAVPPNPLGSTPERGENNLVWLVGSIVVVVLSFVCLTIFVIYRWWISLYVSSPRVSAMYWRFCLLARFFGMPPHASQTPYEYSLMMSRCYPDQAHSFRRLTDLFVREHWGGPQQQTGHLPEGEVQQLWPSLRSILLSLFLNKLKRKKLL
jgi:transglutaminase-like putative cysteine protease